MFADLKVLAILNISNPLTGAFQHDSHIGNLNTEAGD